MTPSKRPAVSSSIRFAVFAVDIVWYVSWAIAVLAIAAALVVTAFPGIRDALVKRQIVRAGTTFSLPLDVEYPRKSTTPAGAGSFQLIGHHDVVLQKPPEPRDAFSFGLYIAAAIFFWTLYQLRALLRAVKSGHPFDPRNPARIRRIGYVLIAGTLLNDAATFLAVGLLLPQVARVVKQAIPGCSVGYHVTFNWQMVVVGLVILAIAHAFDAGVRLQNDQDLTV